MKQVYDDYSPVGIGLVLSQNRNLMKHAGIVYEEAYLMYLTLSFPNKFLVKNCRGALNRKDLALFFVF